jgi:hypothetical protein
MASRVKIEPYKNRPADRSGDDAANHGNRAEANKGNEQQTTSRRSSRATTGSTVPPQLLPASTGLSAVQMSEAAIRISDRPNCNASSVRREI